MNSILENTIQMEFFTYLKPIFASINERQLEYNWLLTDVELNVNFDVLIDYAEQYHVNERNDNRYWITGKQLTSLVNTHEIQFIWGVLSGFRKSEIIDINNLIVKPFADGYPGFWVPEVTVQHPKAEIEIVCWDSTSTLLISEDQLIVEEFKRYFKDARHLDEYNSEE